MSLFIPAGIRLPAGERDPDRVLVRGQVGQRAHEARPLPREARHSGGGRQVLARHSGGGRQVLASPTAS